MNRSFFIFSPFCCLSLARLRFAQVLKSYAEFGRFNGFAALNIESDLTVAAVPCPQKLRGVAARTGVEPVHQP
jgi:hypothetical protein